MIGRDDVGERQQFVAHQRRDVGLHEQPAVAIAQYRIEHVTQRGIALLGARDEAGNHGGDIGRAEIARQDHAGSIDRAALLDAEEEIGDEVSLEHPAANGGIARPVAQERCGHRHHVDASHLHGKDGGAVADMAEGDLRLDRNNRHALQRSAVPAAEQTSPAKKQHTSKIQCTPFASRCVPAILNSSFVPGWRRVAAVTSADQGDDHAKVGLGTASATRRGCGVVRCVVGIKRSGVHRGGSTTALHGRRLQALLLGNSEPRTHHRLHAPEARAAQRRMPQRVRQAGAIGVGEQRLALIAQSRSIWSTSIDALGSPLPGGERSARSAG